MTYVAPEASPAASYYSESYKAVPLRRVVAHQKPLENRRPKFLYRRRLLALDGGKLLLRLWDDQEVEVSHPETLQCEVVNWGVVLPHNQIHDIDRRMSRQFLDLFSKADSQRLSEEETAVWLKILDHVDFASFCIDRAAPRYIEGTLLRKQPVWRVEWHDGEVMKIAPGPASALRILNDGDRFGAFVKFGRNNEVNSIERVVLLNEE